MTCARRRRSEGVGARSSWASVEIVAGSLVAHAVAGGRLPSAFWLMLLAVLAYAASSLVFSKRTGLLTSVVAFGGAQVGVHAYLTAMAPEAHLHHGAEATPNPGWMLLAHAFSAVLAGVVWRLRREALRAIIEWPTAVLTVVETLLPCPAPVLSVPAGRWTVHVRRRGPPGELQFA